MEMSTHSELKSSSSSWSGRETPRQTIERAPIVTKEENLALACLESPVSLMKALKKMLSHSR